MLPLRYVRQWRAASLFLMLGVLAAALMPAIWIWSERREFVTWLVAADKWLHGLVFVVLAIWFAGQYHKRAYWRIAALLLVFGVFIELCQRMVTYRSAEWFDIVADAAGIVTGLAIAIAGLGGWSLRFEDWLKRRGGLEND